MLDQASTPLPTAPEVVEPVDNPDQQLTGAEVNDLPPRQSKYSMEELASKVLRDRAFLEEFFKDFRSVHNQMISSPSGGDKSPELPREIADHGSYIKLAEVQNNSCPARCSDEERMAQQEPVSRVNRTFTKAPPQRLNMVREICQSEQQGVEVPKTYQEAVSSANATDWTQAIQAELESQRANGSWVEVERPRHGKILSLKWIFTLKRDADEVIERFKARVVARGYEQRQGIECFDTYAPVARLEALRALIAVKVQSDWAMQQSDVATAFLHGEMKEEIFVEPP